jgi:hypothetical protein
MADQMSISASRRWRLTVAEDPQFASTQAGRALSSLYVIADQPNDQLEFAFGFDTTQSGGFGGRKATLPGSQSPQTVTFQATFQAAHFADPRLKSIEADLQQMATRVAELGRPPRCLFQWAHRSVTVWVKSVSIRHEGTWLSGLPRRMTASITLEEVVERTLDTTRQGEQPSTHYHVLRAGETPAHLALYYLGDPERGTLIRRDPYNAGLEWVEGDKVRVLPAANAYMRQPIAPSAPCFAPGWEAVLDAYQAEREEDAA